MAASTSADVMMLTKVFTSAAKGTQVS